MEAVDTRAVEGVPEDPAFAPLTPIEEAMDARMGQLLQMPIGWLVEDPHNERASLDEGIDELRASIRERGILEPLVAFRVGPNQYMLKSGHRRRRAAELEGDNIVPVYITNQPFMDVDRSIDRLVANLQRRDLSAMEKARGLQATLKADRSMTQADLAKRLGVSQPAVANTMRLLQLPEPVQAMIEEGKLTAGHGVALLGMHLEDGCYTWDGPDTDNPSTRAELIERYAAWAVEQAWSVKDLTYRVGNHSSYCGSNRKKYFDQLETQRKAQEELEARRAAGEDVQLPHVETAQERDAREAEERRQKAAEGKARTNRVRIAHSAMRYAVAFDPEQGPSLGHLKLAAIALTTLNWYGDTRKYWEMPRPEQLRADILAATTQAELLNLIARIACYSLDVDYQGYKMYDWGEIHKYGEQLFSLNEAISQALQLAGIEIPAGK